MWERDGKVGLAPKWMVGKHDGSRDRGMGDLGNEVGVGLGDGVMPQKLYSAPVSAEGMWSETCFKNPQYHKT